MMSILPAPACLELPQINPLLAALAPLAAVFPVTPDSLDRLLQVAAGRSGSDELESIGAALGRLPLGTVTDADSIRERERDMRRSLEEARQRLAHPEIDEVTLTAALGEETGRILRSAREAASDVRAKAESHAAQISAARLVHSIKAVKNLRQMLRRNAWPGIGHLDRHPALAETATNSD